MYSLTQLQDLINQNLQKINFNLQPVELYEPIEYVLSNGGKRIRPALVLMACNLYNDNIDIAINAALGIEIFHNFTLLHDDIMDHAEIRRNNPTVHIKWDENRAILSGDAMSIKAYELISKSVPSKLPAILQVFNQTALKVCEGQQFDMNYELKENVSIDEYLRMIELKTAVLISGSLKIGSILGGASEDEADKLYEFGRNIGLAFQLQDDLLDAFGSIEKFGKKIGGDIVKNKKTYLLIKAFELADKKNLNLLNELISGNSHAPDEKTDKVISIYNSLNIKKITENKINLYFQEANNWLEKVNVIDNRKYVIKSLSEKLINRTY